LVPEVAVGAIGVPVNVGLADKTVLPVPVLVVTPVPPLATGSVPVTPVVKGSPVQEVNVPDVGVPKTGVPSVGEVDNTTLPVPVDVVTPVPPLSTGSVPVTPVVSGRPVQEVNVPEVGVPRTGVVKVGDVDNTTLPLPVLVVTPVPPLATASVPAKVTAPVDAVLGVSPVVPALNDETALVEDIEILDVEYQCVVEDASKSNQPETGMLMDALALKASIAAPDAG
jgi:hypothetical protein